MLEIVERLFFQKGDINTLFWCAIALFTFLFILCAMRRLNVFFAFLALQVVWRLMFKKRVIASHS